MPPGLIEQQHRVPTQLDYPSDLLQVQGHARGAAKRQNQRRALALARADGAEDVGRCRSLVLRR
jgi:hypothetical protein